MTFQEALLDVQSLSKDFNQTVLEGIAFKVYPQEFLSILGVSGNGKTTLLKCLSGLTPLTRGRIQVAPHDFSRNFSLVFQETTLFPWLTVRENVEVGVSHLARRERQKAVETWLDNLGINSIEDNYPHEIQLAMRQKVNIARAMVSDPLCVLFDQPFSNLDALTAQNLRDELFWLWSREERRPLSFILTTTNIDEAVQLSDRILLMANNPGRIHQEILINLSHPREPQQAEFQKMVGYVEKLFGELHLDAFEHSKARGLFSVEPAPDLGKNKNLRVFPLSPSDPSLVEGLLSHLEEVPSQTIDIYDLSDGLGLRFDEILPAVVAAEQFGFVYTPGTQVGLTALGKNYVEISNFSSKRELMKETCLKVPFIDLCVNFVKGQKGKEGVDQNDLVHYIEKLLPHEDSKSQFQSLILWTQYIDVLSFDSSENRVFLEVDEEKS